MAQAGRAQHGRVTNDGPQETLTIGTDHRPARGRVLVVLLLAAVLGISGYRLVSGAETEAQAQDPPQSLERRSDPVPQPLASERSRLAYAVGRTLHLGGRTLTVQGPGVSGETVVRLQGQAATGWLVTLHPRSGSDPTAEAHGVVDESGRFHPWRGSDGFAGPGVALTSPDGAQVLTLVSGRGWVVDTSSGEPVRAVPAGRPVAWTDDGVHLLRGATGATARLWHPDTGLARHRFDARTCEGSLTAVAASIQAGWGRCRHADLLATSPSGEHAVRSTHVGLSITRRGTPVLPLIRSDTDSPTSARVHRAQFVDETTVAFSFTRRAATGTVSAIVECSITEATCERVGETVPAEERRAGAFLVLPECEHGEGRGVGQTSRRTPVGGAVSTSQSV